MKKLEQKLKNMRVKKKLLLLVVAMIAGILIVGITAFISLSMLKTQLTQVAENWMGSSMMAEEMNTLTSEYRIQQYGHLTTSSEDLMIDYEKKMEDISNQISEISSNYEAQIVEEDDRALLMAARGLWAEYKEEGEKITELSRAGKTDEAAELILGDAKTIYNEFQDAIEALVQYNEDGSAAAVKNTTATFIFVTILIIVIVVCCILIAAAITKAVTASIVGPLDETKTIMSQIVEGNISVRMEYEARDEFGELAGAVNYLTEGLGVIINDERALLNEMAKGNFNLKSEAGDKYVGDFETLLLSMRKIRDKLGGAMQKMTMSTNQVEAASVEMAKEAQALADGATEQASAVEELLASVEEASGKAVQGAEHAVEASAGADSVKVQALRSNERMQEMIGAMDKINNTSKEISSIIETIESIASQTNLLSLNASIEAARAGDAGRGFAVVADEIGKLALQCTEAAGNTRNLIEAAIGETTNGDKIAKETAEELKSVLDGVSKIVEVADVVRIGFEDQSESMKQINNGIDLIAKVVETNSAAAQESSASSEELAAHAQTLKEEMAVFRFRD